MPTTVISTTTSTNATLAMDDYILLEGVTHYNDGLAVATVDTSGASGYQHNIQVHGTLISVFGNTIEDVGTPTGNGMNVTVGATGQIHAAGHAITSLDDNITINNYGTINGQIQISGTNAEFFNQGTYAGSQAVVQFSGGGSTHVVNTGDMTGVIQFDGPTAHFITAANSGNLTGSYFISIGSHTGLITNSGTITAPQGGSAVKSFSSDSIDFDNTGTIYGHIDMDQTQGGQDFISNSGTIHGDIQTGAGNDQITNYGEIHGYIAGGTGDDDYRIYGSFVELVENVGEGWDKVRTDFDHWLEENFEELELEGGSDINGAGNELDNLIAGNGGDNKLYGLDGDDGIAGEGGDDMIRGGRGDDSLYGGDGDDYITGGVGNDRIFGGDGSDDLEGRRGVDRMYGQDGDDVMSGGQGDDRLNGGNGDDILIGGTGLDRMNGGDGIDTFVWNSAAESENGANADLITGFESLTDLLDFSDAMQGDFDINIMGSFTGGGTASIITMMSFADTLVFADVDGDGFADMRVDLIGTGSVSAVDFIV